MSLFLNLCEEFSPSNNENPKWKLIDFLKSKGIKVSLVRDTDMIYIDTGEDTIAVNVSIPEEEAENIEAGFGNYQVDTEVQKLGATADSGLKGMAGKLFGSAPQQAKAALRQRAGVSKQAVNVYKKDTDSLKNSLQNYQRTSSVIPRV